MSVHPTSHFRDASDLPALLRREVSRIRPDFQYAVPFEIIVTQQMIRGRIAAVLGAALALLAFGAGLVGLAGSVLRSVEERRRELAIRSALGAAPLRVVWTLSSYVAAMSALGLAVGMAGGVAAGRLLRSVVHGLGPNDTATLIGVAGFVMTSSAHSFQIASGPDWALYQVASGLTASRGRGR